MNRYGKFDRIYSFAVDLLEELHIKNICNEKASMYKIVQEVFTNDIYEIIKLSGLDEKLVIRECQHTFIQPIYRYYKLVINNDPDKDRFIGTFPKALILECLLHQLCPRNYDSWKDYGFEKCMYFNSIDLWRFRKAALKYCALNKIMPESDIRRYYIDLELFIDDKFIHYITGEKPWLK